MSNTRRTNRRNPYRSGYLRSTQWFRRRDQWFDTEEQKATAIICAVCPQTGGRRDFELHHLDYDGVKQTLDGWIAEESHDDLTACHPRCHELLHRLLDRDRVLGRLRGRRHANVQAIARLRRKITKHLNEENRR